MAVNIAIKQRGIFKKVLTVPEIASMCGLRYGVSDENFCLKEGELDEYSLLYDADKLARGIEIFFDNSDINLKMSLPTTASEIRLFYDLAEAICKKLKVKEYLRDEFPANPVDKERFISADIVASADALMGIREKIEAGETDRFIILGVTNPISLDLKEMEEISEDFDNFEKLLNRLQQMDVYYANPHVYGRPDQSIFGCYAIGEEIASVVPTKPYLLMSDLDVKEWYVLMPESTTVRYEDFIENVIVRDYYDSNHVIVCLSPEEIKSFREKFLTEI